MLDTVTIVYYWAARETKAKLNTPGLSEGLKLTWDGNDPFSRGVAEPPKPFFLLVYEGFASSPFPPNGKKGDF